MSLPTPPITIKQEPTDWSVSESTSNVTSLDAIKQEPKDLSEFASTPNNTSELSGVKQEPKDCSESASTPSNTLEVIGCVKQESDEWSEWSDCETTPTVTSESLGCQQEPMQCSESTPDNDSELLTAIKKEIKEVKMEIQAEQVDEDSKDYVNSPATSRSTPKKSIKQKRRYAENATVDIQMPSTSNAQSRSTSNAPDLPLPRFSRRYRPRPNLPTVKTNLDKDDDYFVRLTNIPQDWDYNDVWDLLKKFQCDVASVKKLSLDKPSGSATKCCRVILNNARSCKDMKDLLANADVNGKKLSVYCHYMDSGEDSTDSDRASTSEPRPKRRRRNPEPWRPDIDVHETDPEGLYGLKPDYLQTLHIEPPIHRWVQISGFRCGKQELQEVMNLAGDALIINNIYNQNPKVANVMYSHPLEAVQAVSMLNDQLHYGKKLTVKMGLNIPQLVLPTGLAAVGPGLGAYGKPLRDIVSHYKRYVKNQSNRIDKNAFQSLDSMSLGKEDENLNTKTRKRTTANIVNETVVESANSPETEIQTENRTASDGQIDHDDDSVSQDDLMIDTQSETEGSQSAIPNGNEDNDMVEDGNDQELEITHDAHTHDKISQNAIHVPLSQPNLVDYENNPEKSFLNSEKTNENVQDKRVNEDDEGSGSDSDSVELITVPDQVVEVDDESDPDEPERNSEPNEPSTSSTKQIKTRPVSPITPPTSNSQDSSNSQSPDPSYNVDPITKPSQNRPPFGHQTSQNVSGMGMPGPSNQMRMSGPDITELPLMMVPKERGVPVVSSIDFSLILGNPMKRSISPLGPDPGSVRPNRVPMGPNPRPINGPNPRPLNGPNPDTVWYHSGQMVPSPASNMRQMGPNPMRVINAMSGPNQNFIRGPNPTSVPNHIRGPHPMSGPNCVRGPNPMTGPNPLAGANRPMSMPTPNPGPMPRPMDRPMTGPFARQMGMAGQNSRPIATSEILRINNIPPLLPIHVLREKLRESGQVLELQFTAPGVAVARFANIAQATHAGKNASIMLEYSNTLFQ